MTLINLRNFMMHRIMAHTLFLTALPLLVEAKPDWVDKPLASDPKENAKPCDWLEFHARPDKDGLKLAYRCAAQVNFSLGAAYSVYLDTDGRRDTGFRGSEDQFPIGADYLLQGATLFRYGGHYGERNGLDWAWTSLGLVKFNVSDEWADFILPSEQINAKVGIINVMLIGDNTAADVDGNFNDEFPDNALKKSGANRFIQIRFEDAAK